MNPVTDIVGAIGILIKLHRVNDWAKLGAGVFMSGLCTFLGACGAALSAAAKAGFPAAICWVFGWGAGMPAAAGVMAFVFIKNPLTKGILWALPKETAADAQALGPEVTLIEKK